MVGSNLDPRSRPGTILPGLNINPYDVWQKRVATEQEAGKLAAAKAKQDAENKKAALEAGKYEFKEVHRPHTAEYTQLGNEYINQEAARMQKFAQTKNPDDDPNNYGSRAWTEREQGRLGLQQYAGYSNQQKSMAEKYQEKKFASPSLYTPEDDEWVSLVTTMSPLEAIEKGINLQDPNIIGHWDKDEVLTPIKNILESEEYGGATYDPDLDMFITTSGKKVTTERVDQAAFAIAAPGTIGGFRWGNEIEKLSDAEKKRINEGAARLSKKYNREITPEQFKASEDAKSIARSGSTTTKSRAGFFEAESGYDLDIADRVVSATLGLSSMDPKFLEEYAVEVKSGPNNEIYEGRVYKTDAFNGYVIEKDSKGNETRIKGIYVTSDGRAIIETDQKETKTDNTNPEKPITTTKIKTIETPANMFANNFMEPLTEFNTELKKGPVERILKKKGVVDERTGKITPPQPSGPVKETGLNPVAPAKKEQW
jgi:hypothetical protein